MRSLPQAQRHRRDRRLRCGRRDQHGAGGAAAARASASRRSTFSCRIAFSTATDSRPRSCAWRRRRKPALIVTVDNGISSHAGVDEARCARHRHADHGSSSRAADAAGCDGARESECAGQFVSEQGARRRRRRVLSDGGADSRDAGARPARGRRAGRGPARPGRARHGRGSRAARSQQPRARASGAAPHSRRSLLRRRSRAAGSCEPSAGSTSSPPISAIRSGRA